MDEFEFFDGLPKEEEYHVDESVDDLDLTLKEEEKIAPMMLFLASSLNVELVYIILTGLTQFAKMNSNNINVTDFDDLQNESKVEIEERESGTSILLRTIEIENVDKWSSQMRIDDYIEDNRASFVETKVTLESESSNNATLLKNVKVKFH